MKINYSLCRVGDEIFIYCEKLLFETDIKTQNITVGTYNEIKTLFSHGHSSDLSFDPFCAAFFLVSRYEEYLPFNADKHNRFPAEASILYRVNSLSVPVVNYYAEILHALIQSHYPDFNFPEKEYQCLLTYDIDMAFEFQQKGFVRNAAGIIRSLMRFDIHHITYRAQVLTGKKKDAFDTFDYQDNLSIQFSLQPIYFFLLGNRNPYDINLSWKNKRFRTLIRTISEKYQIGIHFSYASNENEKLMAEEMHRLEMISEKKILRNRQHFLKLSMPETYRRLLHYGIREDYTMGYPSQVGFRAGIASPFNFYDLAHETSTALVVYPFAVMDATLHYYLRLSPEQALQQTKQIIEEVKKVNGYFIFLAHNDLIGKDGPWKGWSENFEEVLRYMKN